MKVGFMQMDPILGESPNNAMKIRNAIEKAGEFDLLVLPELANSGYNFDDAEMARRYAEDIKQSHFIDILQKVCSVRKCHIVTGFCEQDDDRIFNSAVLVNGEGVVGTYRKIHLFNNEKDYFEPGDSQPEIYTIGDMRFGILVCFDWAFPEIWRILALKGADLVAHPANLVVKGGGDKAAPVHAKTNSYYVVTSNRIGTERELTFTGGSLISGPDGNLLAQASTNQQEIMIVDIDVAKARDKNITPKNHMLNDRRPDLYKGLLG